MLKQIDFTYFNSEYCILYDDAHMTQEQAEKECEFMGWGMGYDETLYPYYLIVPKKKRPVLSCIKEYLTDKGYDIAHNLYMEMQYGD